MMTISATLLLAQLTTTALAQESAKWDNTDPIDIGILKDKDISVVQQRLYPKSKHKELGAHLGVMPFDPFSVTPKVELSYGQHLSGLWLGKRHWAEVMVLKAAITPL